ncbi:hypothetical protein SAMN05421837_10446 [Amycolatopsis pretoriensis]|uniref:Uncharacterized protein n=1 Tax=Amycolatopsis pretoriensis TaxID=218821 RepID=A0A1H5QSI3_9PSEU|nr:hypothetical protein [Amycolatopsis pretoriensis]SEF28177.1 hypothetical protein SAMN05421837_10446 [Amycolatopsis pretoriensis]
MVDHATNEGQGAKRAGRFVSRALLVLGGAVAGTAAAWLVSGAVASADTVEVGTAPITEAATGSVGDVNAGATDAASDVSGSNCHQDATAWSDPCARVLGHEVSDRVGDSVSDFAEDAVVSPAHRTLGAVEHIVRKPQDTREVLERTFTPEPAHDVWQLLDPAGHGDLVALPGLSPVEQQPVTTTAGQATDPVAVSTVQLPAALRAALAMPTGSQHDDGTGGTGDTRDSHRDLPSPLTPAQLPVAPFVPTAPGGSTAPGGHLDGLNFGVPFWTTEAVDSAVAAMSRAGLRTTMRTPGEQPGVTPD